MELSRELVGGNNDTIELEWWLNLGGVSLESELASMPDLSAGKSDKTGSSLVKSGIVFVPFHIRQRDWLGWWEEWVLD